MGWQMKLSYVPPILRGYNVKLISAVLISTQLFNGICLPRQLGKENNNTAYL